MKKHILLLAATLFLSAAIAFGQIKIDKFCEVTVSPNRFTRISFGNNKWLFNPKDTSIFEKLRYVNSLTNATDVLNYMSKIGWSLVSIHFGPFARYIDDEKLYFSKAFDVSDFVEDVKTNN